MAGALHPPSSRRRQGAPQNRAQSPRCRHARSFELNLIVFDQGVGEELVGCLLERGFRLLLVAAFDLDVEHLALAHACHAGNAEGFERPLDRLALGVKDAGFERNGDAGLHRVSSCSRYVAKFRRKPAQCTGAAAVCSKSRPRPATWPLSPTSRSAAQNAACVLETTGMPWRASSGCATPSVRKPPQEISRPSAPGTAVQTLEPSAMISASLLLPGSPKPNRPKPSSASTSKPCAIRKALSRLFTSSA